jgi:hypothetical protein
MFAGLPPPTQRARRRPLSDSPTTPAGHLPGESQGHFLSAVPMAIVVFEQPYFRDSPGDNEPSGPVVLHLVRG